MPNAFPGPRLPARRGDPGHSARFSAAESHISPARASIQQTLGEVGAARPHQAAARAGGGALAAARLDGAPAAGSVEPGVISKLRQQVVWIEGERASVVSQAPRQEPASDVSYVPG